VADNYAGRLEYEDYPSGADRRRAPRLAKAFDLTYQVKSLPDEKTLIETLDKLLTGQTSDVSAVGVSMWTARMLMPGTTIELVLPSPIHGADPIRIDARVAWCQPHTEGGVVRSRMGLEFVDVAPDVQARLLQLING
jgi:c-di-GMP-binding flagellar brake protein YcgR